MLDFNLRRIFFYRGHAITCQAAKGSDGRYQASAVVMFLLGRRPVSQQFLDFKSFCNPEDALATAKVAAVFHVDRHWAAEDSKLGRSLPLRPMPVTGLCG